MTKLTVESVARVVIPDLVIAVAKRSEGCMKILDGH